MDARAIGHSILLARPLALRLLGSRLTRLRRQDASRAAPREEDAERRDQREPGLAVHA